jgi:hypothetical protein
MHNVHVIHPLPCITPHNCIQHNPSNVPYVMYTNMGLTYCFFHLHRLRQLRQIFCRDVIMRLVCTYILVRLDYCNCVLAELPAKTLKPLERVMNAAPRLVMDLRPRDHITKAMRTLQWLPLVFRIKYKLCVMMHSIVNGRCPAYIGEIVQPIADISGRTRLRSATTNQYDVPRTRTEFGKRAFSIVAPRQWNELPLELRQCDGMAAFK